MTKIPQGDGHTLAQVSHEHRAWLKQIAARLARPGLDPDDLVQDVLAKFLATFGDKPVSSERISVWLHRALMNLILSQSRKMSIRRRALEDPTFSESQALTKPLDEPLSTFELISDEDLELALESLSEKQRRVFELRHSGESYAEIAKKLGIPPGVVGKRLFDARKHLRLRLTEIATKKTRAG